VQLAQPPATTAAATAAAAAAATAMMAPPPPLPPVIPAAAQARVSAASLRALRVVYPSRLAELAPLLPPLPLGGAAGGGAAGGAGRRGGRSRGGGGGFAGAAAAAARAVLRSGTSKGHQPLLWLAQLALIHLPARRRLACVRALLQAAAELSSSPPRSARAVHPALPLVDAAALPALLLLLVTSLAATLEEQLRPPTPAALSRALRTLDTAAALSTRTLRALLSLALPPSATGVLCAACAALSVALRGALQRALQSRCQPGSTMGPEALARLTAHAAEAVRAQRAIAAHLQRGLEPPDAPAAAPAAAPPPRASGGSRRASGRVGGAQSRRRARARGGDSGSGEGEGSDAGASDSGGDGMPPPPPPPPKRRAVRAPPKQGLALPRLLLRLDHLDQEIHEARHTHHVPAATAEADDEEAAGGAAGAADASVGAQLDRLGRSSGHAARGLVDEAGAGAEEDDSASEGGGESGGEDEAGLSAFEADSRDDEADQNEYTSDEDDMLGADGAESGDEELLASQFVARYDRAGKRPRSTDADTNDEAAESELLPQVDSRLDDGETIVVRYRAGGGEAAAPV